MITAAGKQQQMILEKAGIIKYLTMFLTFSKKHKEIGTYFISFYFIFVKKLWTSCLMSFWNASRPAIGFSSNASV